jgi:hypothetical protein
MSTVNLYTTITLKDNTTVEILNVTGGDFSRALHEQRKQDIYDMMPFLMQCVCRIEGKRQEVQFFTQLPFEDYNHILQVIDIQISPPPKI